jgi:hypothetical protein
MLEIYHESGPYRSQSSVTLWMVKDLKKLALLVVRRGARGAPQVQGTIGATGEILKKL